MGQKLLSGTELKMAVNFRYPSDPSVTLDSIDFYVEFYCSKSRVIKLGKSELIREEETIDGVTTVNWYAMLDTTNIGAGALKMRMMAYIPDNDASEYVREEYAEVDTNVIIDWP